MDNSHNLKASSMISRVDRVLSQLFYGRIETPLMALLKKDAFSWIPEATKALEDIIQVM